MPRAWWSRATVVSLLMVTTSLLAVSLIGSEATGKSSVKRVRVMVEGPKRTIAGASLLKARGATVRAGKKRCKVMANTPLAALVAASRRSNFGIRMKDFGNCSKKLAANSSQLFVDKVGSFSNKGNDGWFFKVNDKAGTTGAADPSGPFGNGVLRSGDRVAWFYCKYRKSSGSCQRTLRLISRKTAQKGGAFRVKVIGYDNSKRGSAISKARVRFAGQTVVTDKKGRVVLRPRRKGRFKLTASRAGMIPAFATQVQVD